jgi:transposase
MQDAGILPDFAGIVVSDRYQNYFHPRWEHIAGNQACLAHILRDFEDCAESYPGSVWPVQAQRALRGLIRAWHAAREQGLEAIPASVRTPLEHEFRHAVLAGLASVPRVPGPKNSTKQKPGRELLEFCRDRRSDVPLFAEDTGVWPTNNISDYADPPIMPTQKQSPWSRMSQGLCRRHNSGRGIRGSRGIPGAGPGAGSVSACCRAGRSSRWLPVSAACRRGGRPECW